MGCLFKKLFLVSTLLFLLASAATAKDFYRIVDGPNPGPRQQKIDELLYGAKVLYTGDAKRRPTQVDGVVWHTELKQERYFVGTENPVIENRAMLKQLEDDKWEEAKLLQKYAPEALPRTENMGEIGLPLTRLSLPEVFALLRRRYPEGFFLKPVGGWNSNGGFPSDKTDFAKLSPFERQVFRLLFRHPEAVLVQERLRLAVSGASPDGKPIVEEYRVHLVQGQILRGATVHRWHDEIPMRLSENGRKAERFVEELLKKLPPEFQKMSAGLDVMITQDGECKTADLNVGGASGYLYPDDSLWLTQLLAEHYTGKPTPLQSKKRAWMKRLAAKGRLEASCDSLLRH